MLSHKPYAIRDVHIKDHFLMLHAGKYIDAIEGGMEYMPYKMNTMELM